MKRRDFIKQATLASAGTVLNAATLNKATGQVPSNPASATSNSSNSPLSLPKGGGSIKGIGETFQANPFTGTGNFSVPIYTSPGRGGMTPQLSLDYSTGNGNGIFGQGWSLSVPGISRKTEKGIPQYNDEEDVFILSGAEDLVPVLEGQSHAQRTEQFEGITWHIYQYRPRVEGLHALIEYWKPGSLAQRDARSFWRVVSKDNLVNIYGCSPMAKVSDPAKVSDFSKSDKIFEWRLELTADAKGNCIWYQYKKEEGLDPKKESIPIYEAHRYDQTDEKSAKFNQIYLKNIYYGNVDSLVKRDMGYVYPVLQKGLVPLRFLFNVCLDYGEHQACAQVKEGKIIIVAQDSKDQTPIQASDNSNFYHQLIADNTLAGPNKWASRKDPFSSYRAGFEIRTYRRCARVLMFHQFPEFKQPVLVRSSDFHYTQNAYNNVSMLNQVIQRGYRRVNDEALHQSEEVYLKSVGVVSEEYAIKSFTPLSFTYSSFQPEKQTFQAMQAEGNDMPERALNHPDFALVDLFGTGLPDVLHSSPAGYYYWKNEGKGKFSSRRTLKSIPANLQLSIPGIGFGDMEGNGQADLLVHSGGQWGFFEADGNAAWREFKPYRQQPSFSIDDPQTRLFDLDGSGRAGALNTSNETFRYSPCVGGEGFGPPIFIRRQHNLDVFPDVDFSDPRVKLADMSGDGLNDIVLIHSGRIDYWANLGYGKFSHRITLKNSPNLGLNFDPKRLFLMDLDGSGTADAVYVENDKVRFWFNQSGNAWSQEFVIHGTPPVTDVSALVSADILGNGNNCLLWTMDWPGINGKNYRYLDFTGGVKPHLLIEMDNSMGSITRVQYKSSTAYYLEDQQQRPRLKWASTLPFPVQCLEKVERIDQLSGTKLVTRYRYHHGYYDGKEREFRGFALVEQWDTESFQEFRQSKLFADPNLVKNGNEAYHVPPIKTKTWFHTGAYNSSELNEETKHKLGGANQALNLHDLFRHEYYNGDPTAFRADACRLDFQGIRPDARALPLAYRALRGSMLRQEVYAEDGSAKAHHPYLVTEQAYVVKTVQARTEKHAAVFQTVPWEKLSHHYERNPIDPRVVQELTLRTDPYGNVLTQCSLAYPRRAAESLAEQQKSQVTLSETQYVNTAASEHQFRFIGIKFEESSFEVNGLFPKLGLQPEESRTKINGRQLLSVLQEPLPLVYTPMPSITWSKRRLSHSRTYFLDSNKKELLPLGSIDHLGLVGESYAATFEQTSLEQVYKDVLNLAHLNRLLAEGGYVKLEDFEPSLPIWWSPSGRQEYDPAQFYQVVATLDPWKNKSQVKFDAYALLPVQAIDPLGQSIHVKNDYISLQAATLRDINGNGTKVVFDALGLVIASATMGKLDGNFAPQGALEGDNLEYFTPQWEYNKTFHDLIDHPYQHQAQDSLKDASACMLYDLWRTKRLDPGAPPVVWMAQRETHQANDTLVQQKLLFFDGLGRELQTKIEAEPHRNDPSGRPRWIASGWKIYNNKGKVVQQYQPFYTLEPEYEANCMEECSSTLFYDPMERVICTVHPNQTYEKVVFDAWKQETWDTNDTIDLDILRDSDIRDFVTTFIQKYVDCTSPNTAYLGWKTNNLDSGKPEQIRAVQQTLQHANTPSTAHLDTLGRAFLNITRNGTLPADEFHTRTTLDIQGNELAISDPRGLTCFQHHFDLQQRQLWIGSVDAGPKWVFPAVDKQVIWSKDANGNQLVYRFDALRRPTQSWVKTAQASSYFLAQEQLYGEQSNLPNMKGKVWRIFDGAGMVENLECDFKGNLVSTRRQLLQNKKGLPQWAQALDPWLSTAQANASLLSSEVFKSDSSFDALNRLIEHTLPNGTHKTFVYNKSNLLKATQVDGQDYVRFIDYNAKGQREHIEYGNGIRTEYTYEPSTYRLLTIKSSKGGQDFQDLHYTYDPVGNITQIADDAIEPIFFQNRKIEAVKHYHYDPLYRLIAASGRELEGASRQNTCENILFKQAHGIPLPQNTRNRRALRYYAETYTYDKAGNITSKKHYTNHLNDDGSPRGNPVYSQTQTYATDSNRILSTTCAGYTKNCRHDDNGNLDNLYAGMFWDYNNRLIGVQKQLQNDAEFYTEAPKTDLESAEIHYQYDSQGNRVTKLVGNKLRVYMGDYEQYTDDNASASITIHVMDDKSRVATIDTGAKLSSPVIRYQLSDHLGSAAMEVDENGRIISMEEYLPYGGTAVWGYHATGISTKRYRYSGKEKDEETGMYYYGARYYVAWMGRWCGCDPLLAEDDLNLFKFLSSNNPTKHVDPKGKETANFPGAGLNPSPASSPVSELKRTTGGTSLESFPSNSNASRLDGQQKALTSAAINDVDALTIDKENQQELRTIIDNEQIDLSARGTGSKKDPTLNVVLYSQEGDCGRATTKGLNQSGYLISGDGRSGYLTESQFLPPGAVKTDTSVPTLLEEHIGRSILDVIDENLFHGKPIAVGIDYEEGGAGGKKPDGITDHWAYIIARTYDKENRVIYILADNAGNSNDIIQHLYVDKESFTLMKPANQNGSTRYTVNYKYSIVNIREVTPKKRN